MESFCRKYSALRLRDRMASTILSFALVATLLFSMAFMTLEANHDCDGADCAVCQCIQAAESFLESVCPGPAAAVVLAVLSLLFVALLVDAWCVGSSFTLVQQKVRLDV